MKKFTAIVLACIMLLSAFPALSVSAASVSKESTAVTEFPCEIGELKDGYKLYYNGIAPVEWVEFFDVVYGKYTFTSTNEGERGHGLFVAKGDEEMFLSEAIEKGITDIDTAVKLIQSRDDIGYPFYITNMDDVYAALEERYNGRKFNLVDLGCVYSAYRLYYNVPEIICTWVITFEYSGYTFTESGGQIGSMIPEDLGLYVVGNGEVYNLEEADKNPLLNMDKIVSLINAQDIDYTFKVMKTEDIKPIKEKFLDYLYETHHFESSIYPLVDYAELGAIRDTNDILIYGYQLEQPIQGSYIELGEYTVWSPATDYTTGAGLYVYHQNGTFDKLWEVKDKYNAGDIINLIKKAPAKHRFIIADKVNVCFSMLYRYSNHFRNLVNLGEVSEGYNLYYNIPEDVCAWVQEFEYGDYIFRETGGQWGNVSPEDLGLFVIGNYKVYNLGEAYENNIVDIEKVVELIRVNDLNYSFYIVKNEPDTTQPDNPTVTEPDPTAPTEPATTAPTQPDNTPLGKYKQFLAENWKDKNPDDFEVDVFKKLKSGLYLVHYVQEFTTDAMYYSPIDKYLYVAPGSASHVAIFDSDKCKTYDLSKAYKKGIIKKKHLKTISETLDEVDNVAKLYENIEKLKVGKKHSAIYGKGLKVKSSKPKVVKVIKNKNGKMRLVAKKKGNAKITVKKKNGAKYSFKIKVR